MTRYFAGIDGGQSSTAAVVADEAGRVLGRGLAGGADEVGVAPGSTRLRDALQGALAGALAAAGLPPATRFEAVVAGVSGFEGRIYGAAPSFETPRFALMHDGPVAHAGALGGEPGIVAIAGSGSVVYATGSAGAQTLGGWGYLFGDEGSGFWLVREALAELMRREDDGDRAMAAEAGALCAFFGAASMRELARAFYSGGVGRERLASAAPLVLEYAAFDAIVEAGTRRLAELVARAIAAGAAPLYACAGGLFASAAYRERAYAALRRRSPGLQVIEPRCDPAVGALLLAYREAGAAPAGLPA